MLPSLRSYGSPLELIGSLSKGVFERRTSTGSEVFSLLTCLDDIKFVFLSFFTVIEAIWLKICAKPPSKNQKRPLPVDVRRSKTLLLKLPIAQKLERKCERKMEKGGGEGEGRRGFFSPPIPSSTLIFALVTTFSIKTRGNACYSG